MKTILLLFLAAGTMLQTGCVLGRRSISLSVPSGPAATASRGEIAITSVVDQRAFENNPSEPSTPSIDGDVKTLSASQRDKMAGRQRNTWGHAMGDIALSGGDTVTSATKRLLEEALKRRGYRVVASARGNTAAAAVREFWTWMSPGAFALGFKARISCTVTLHKDGRSTVLVVTGYGLNNGQFAKDTNWEEAYDEAFKDFLNKFDAAASAAGF